MLKKAIRSLGSAISKINQLGCEGCSYNTCGICSIKQPQNKLINVNGIVLNNNRNELVQYNLSQENFTIPTSVTDIADNAFYGHEELKSVTIHTHLFSIGGGAFSGCNGLLKINIPNSVDFIGKYAFALCNNIKVIDIPKNTVYVGDRAFYKWNSDQIVNIIGKKNRQDTIDVGWDKNWDKNCKAKIKYTL